MSQITEVWLLAKSSSCQTVRSVFKYQYGRRIRSYKSRLLQETYQHLFYGIL